MKHFYFTLVLLLLNLISKGQSITSICWPPESTSNLVSCNSDPNDFPIVNDSLVYYSYFGYSHDDIQAWVVDSTVINAMGQCEQLIKDFYIVDKSSQDTFSKTITYNIDENLSLANSLVRLYSTEPFEDIEIHVEDLVIDPILGHKYSFSSKDSSQSTFILPENFSAIQLQVYEFTTNSWYNKTAIERTDCNSDKIDSVTWPYDTIYVGSCSDIPIDFPIVNGITYESGTSYNDCIYVTYNVYGSIDSLGNCISVKRDIFLLHWISGETILDSVIYIVQQNLDLAKELHFIDSNYPPNDIFVKASDLVKTPIPGHIYSFSSLDASLDSILISSDELEKQTVVFEHTTKSWYNATIIKRSPCIGGYDFDIHPSIDLDINAYFDGVVSASIFDNNSYNNCGDYSLKIARNENGNFDEDIFFEPTIESGTYEVFIKFEMENGYSFIKSSFVHITVDIYDIFTKYIELKEVVAGEETDVAIWSSGIDKLLGFQYGLKIKDAEFVGLSELNPKFVYDLAGNYAFINDEFRIVKSFVNEINTFEENEIWYNIRIIPDQSGLTSDIFSWEDLDFDSGFYIEDEFAIFEIEVPFNFEMAQNPIALDAVDHHQKDIIMYPNPSSGKVYWDGVSVTDIRSIVNLQNIKFPTIISEGALITNHLPEGIYFISFGENENFFTKKLVIAR